MAELTTQQMSINSTISPSTNDHPVPHNGELADVAQTQPVINEGLQGNEEGAETEELENQKEEAEVQESIEAVDNEEDDEEDDEEDEDEDEDEDEEEESELSDGDDLMEELEDVFGYDFDFKGDFYHSETLSLAPNPCLYIEGLGAIGLPLTPRDADLLIRCSSQAPFGQGTQLVVNPHVRHTWEIEPQRVRFLNAEWANFIQNTVIKSVQDSLGATTGASQPRCELYKLLLYETGSHFMPHQDTEKAPGMFATVIVVLPSFFSGGEVHVSHASKTHVIDIAARSMTTTSVLAWYTDVTHEVKPITSGFRLALSYNLIHTSTNVPRPSIPTENYALQQLKRILRKWKEDRYMQFPEDDQVAYILSHQYSPQSLRNGLQALKGQDAHLVSHLRAIADEFGFHIFLGNLKYSQRGSPDGDGYGYSSYHKRRRYYYDEDEDEDDAEGMNMDEVYDTTVVIENAVDVDGTSLQGPEISLGEDCLIPKDAFEDVDPDGKEYEGYMGNYPGDLEQWYCRSVVLIVNEDNVGCILHYAGAQYHITKLSKSDLDNPTQEDRKKAISIASRLSASDREPGVFLMKLSLKWKDADLWTTVVSKSGTNNTASNSILTFECFVSALTLFGFATVRPHFEAMAKAIPRLKGRIDFVRKLQNLATSGPHPEMDAWCGEQYREAVAALSAPTTEDIPTIILVAKEKGLGYLADTFLPRLVERPDFNFLVAFAQALHDNRNMFTQSPTSVLELGGVLQLTLNLIVRQWDTVVAQPAGYYGHYNANPYQAKLQRVMKIMELCSSIGHANYVQVVLGRLIDMKGNQSALFASFYTPLIAQVSGFMARHGIDFSTPTSPFSSFLKILVEIYLHHVLAGPAPTTHVTVRKIGCGCMDCGPIDRFISNETMRDPQVFRMAKPRRVHIEGCLSRAQDLVRYSVVTSGSPHGVNVVKNATLAAAQSWNCRANEAKTFLKNVSNHAALSTLMGERYKDVLSALKGTQAYKLDRSHQDAISALINASPPGAMAAPIVPAAPSSSAIASTSQKRKQPERKTINLGVVDLTGED